MAGCASQGSRRIPENPPLEDTSIGPGDSFEVRVLGEKDLSGVYQVGTTGQIEFPYVGSIEVAGKEAPDVAKSIADGLTSKGFLKEPQVSVLLQASASKRVSVIGAVAKPGTLPIVPGMTVIYAVSQVGGFTPLASKDDTVITRRVSGKLERYRVAVSQITRGNSEDVPLRSGDIVYVPERVF